MLFKKDRYCLLCRIKYSTAEMLKFYSTELGISVGEVVDMMIKGYDKYLNSDDDDESEQKSIHDILSTLVEKIDRIEQKMGE